MRFGKPAWCNASFFSMTPPIRSPLTAPDDDASKGQIRQANEARILAAAECVFGGAGFGGATMAVIADQTELPKANLHDYFGSKQDLYCAVLARTRIEAYIRAKLALALQRPHASRVFANELSHGAPVDPMHLFFYPVGHHPDRRQL